MSLWVAVLIASLLSVAVKLAGYLVPESVMAGERTRRVTTLLPVALLAALVVVQSVTGDAGAIGRARRDPASPRLGLIPAPSPRRPDGQDVATR